MKRFVFNKQFPSSSPFLRLYIADFPFVKFVNSKELVKMKKTFFNLQKKLVAIGMVMLGVGTLVSCSKSLDNDYQQPDIPVAGLMAFNLATDRTVGVSLSGNSLSGNALAFSNYTGNYLRIYTGNRTFEARDAANGNIIASTPFSADSSRYYSGFVLGANGAYKNVVVNDNFDSLSGSNGQAYVRYINAVPDSTHTATVSISANGANLSSATANYGSVSDFKAVAPGSVTIAISKNGITKDRTFTLEQQKAYTVLLLGVPNSNTADSMQVRYITNGTLSGTTNANGRMVSNASSAVKIN